MLKSICTMLINDSSISIEFTENKITVTVEISERHSLWSYLFKQMFDMAPILLYHVDASVNKRLRQFLPSITEVQVILRNTLNWAATNSRLSFNFTWTLCVCGLSSWLHNNSWTSAILVAVRTQCGRPLPFCRSVVPILSTFFSRRSRLVLLHFLFGNSVRSRLALQPFSWRKHFIRQRSIGHLSIFYPYYY